MSRGTAKKAKELDAQPQLIFDAKRDINPFWRSSLFSDVYLKNDVPREYKHQWENDEIGGFYNFYQGFIDLCVETEHESFEKWKEADTVKNWIVHVMDLLGWENNSERRSNSYMDNESFTVLENGRKQTFRPDLIYFDKPKHKSYTQKEKDSDRKLSEARDKRTGTKIIVEAKYWDRLSHIAEQSKKDTKLNDSASALGPELQTLKYMEIFDHDFGVLTDGKTWRLFHKELSQGVDRRSFDFDLGNLRELALDLGTSQNEEKFRHYAKYFYYFFSKDSLIQTEDLKTAPFVYEVFEYSKKYAHSIEEDLKKRFIVSMGITCNSLKVSCEDQSESFDIDTIRNVSESHLFNILFVKSCEVRRILPICSTQYLRVSLHEVIETLDAMGFDPDKDWDDYLRDFKFMFGEKFDWGGYEIFNRFINLYEIIHDGTATSKDFGFEVEGFKESIFNKGEWRFAKKHKINNRNMIEILFHLNFIDSNFKGRKYQQIPYSYFTPRQLGSIYESFLDYKLEVAETDMVFKKGQWKSANLKSKKVRGLRLADEQLVQSGMLFFSPNNKERKVTGAYYTPDFIVKEMVENTLGNHEGVSTSDKLLELKICDPAMGSGHFLAGVLDYLVQKYRNLWSEEKNDDIEESIEETSRKILDSCIFGVDINPRAVKLARMSMWLSTAYPGRKLENLDDQLKCGDSIVGFNWEKEFKQIYSDGGFDVVIGNPPYIGQKGNKDLFERFKSSKEWSSFYERKQDIYYYFIARSIKLLKSNGALSFIVPPYFLTALAAKNLRQFIIDNGVVNQYIDMSEDLKVFDSASISSVIFSFEKSKNKENDYIKIFKPTKINDVVNLKGSEIISKYKFSDLTCEEWYLSNTEDDLDLNESGNVVLLGDISNISPGVQTGCDRVSKSHIEKLGLKGLGKGEGIFVLSNDELNSLKLNKDERKYFKPFFKNSEIAKFGSSYENKEWLLVTNLIDDIEKVPNIKKHLSRYRKILDARYRNFALKKADEKGAWWYLYGFRPNTNFDGEKIVLPYRSSENTFSFSDSSFYGSIDIFVVNPEDSKFRTKYLLGVLCSDVVKNWLMKNCKKKGKNLELYQKPLSQIPIPVIADDLQMQVVKLVDEIIVNEDEKKVEELNSLVESLYTQDLELKEVA